VVKSTFVDRFLHFIGFLPGFLFRTLRVLLALLVTGVLLASSTLPLMDRTEKVRTFTRAIEFDYVGWTLNALRVKQMETVLGADGYLSADVRKRMVLDYLELVVAIHALEGQINQVYADPNVPDPQAASRPLRDKLEQLNARSDQLAPLAEAILQSQVSYVAEQFGLTQGGQPVPPVLYHSTPLPLALIVSPRNIIRQDEDVSLIPDLSIDKRAELEQRVDRALDVSSLVVEIGGVGTYPTMVQQTSDLNWLSEVVAHEWVHNFLTLRPLGMSYMSSPQLRIMNETAAAIAGKEIGRDMLETFYPELLPPLPPPPGQGGKPPEPPAFDFRKEMYLTRQTVDQLLAEGKIEEAEEYMEVRRLVFWEHGYRGLRKLNQAYFAFHGAYADEPGGAAGVTEDPVGAAVRALRAQSSSLADFLNRISWLFTYEQLQQAVEQGSS
jgi:hypothetical protein